MESTSRISVQWFWRVVIWLLIELDIPQLSSDGIQKLSFGCTYSLQSSSIHSLISSSFDATSLEYYISFGDKTPSSTSYVVKNRASLNSIPLDVEDLWIGRFDTTGIIEFPFNRFQSLKSLVIGNCIFWEVTCFELSNFPTLQSIDIGGSCFYEASYFSLTGSIDRMEWYADLPQLQSVKLGDAAFNRVHSVVFESDWMNGLMIQICPNYNPFNLVHLLFMVMRVMIDSRLAMNPSTTRTHWQCEVRLNAMMNE